MSVQECHCIIVKCLQIIIIIIIIIVVVVVVICLFVCLLVDNLLDDGVNGGGEENYYDTVHVSEEGEWSNEEEEPDGDVSPVATGGTDHYEMLVSQNNYPQTCYCAHKHLGQSVIVP